MLAWEPSPGSTSAQHTLHYALMSPHKTITDTVLILSNTAASSLFRVNVLVTVREQLKIRLKQSKLSNYLVDGELHYKNILLTIPIQHIPLARLSKAN